MTTSRLFVEGSTICLIGTASSGPVNRLVYADNSNRTSAIFGRQSQLARAASACYQEGAQSVFVIRINGKPASANIQDKIKITSLLYNEEDNGVSITINGSVFLIDETHVYELTDDKTMDDLVDEINEDVIDGIHHFKAEVLTDCLSSSLGDGVVLLDGGTQESSLSDEEIHNRLTDIYFYLLKYPVNIVVPLCADYTSPQRFDIQLISFCKSKFENGEDTVGVMPVSPPQLYEEISQEESVDDHVQLLNSFSRHYDHDGRFLSVVVNEGVFYHYGRYIGNCAPAYAGRLSANSLESTTNKTLRSVIDLPYEYSREQVEQLGQYVVLKTFRDSDIRVCQGNTLHSGFSIDMTKIINKVNTILQEEFYDFTVAYNIDAMEIIIKQKAENALATLLSEPSVQLIEVEVDNIDTNSQNIDLLVTIVKYPEIRRVTTKVGVYYRPE